MSVKQSPPSIARIGGEMYSWSDRDAERGPAVVASLGLSALITELAGAGRAVLVAGPHDDRLVAALLDGGAEVSYLVRSLPDAELLAARFPDATVLCGSVAKLPAGPRFDLVVAADGFGRLVSAEGAQSAPVEIARALTGVLAPDGTLLAIYRNPLGVDSVVELAPGGHYPVDAAWSPHAESDERWPASLTQVEAQLRGEGLDIAGYYAVYPTCRRPSVFIDADLIGAADSPARGQLAVALSTAFTAAYRDTPVLRDPRPLVAGALRAGLEGTLAAGWLMLARRGGSARPATHGVVIDVGDCYAYDLTVADGMPHLEVLAGVDAAAVAPRAGLRRVAPATDLPARGRIFAERLLPLCAAADLPALRAELGRFVAWVDARSANGTLAGPEALSTFDTVLDDGEDLRGVPAGWEPVDPVAATTLITRAVWRFAATVVVGNHPHPWQLTASVADLTATLLGMVGRVASRAEYLAAVELELAWRTAEQDLSLPAAESVRLELTAMHAGAATLDLRGYRELADALWRQRYQVSHLLSALDWTEQMIGSRDRAVSQMDWEIQLYRRSWPGRFLMMLRAGYKALRRDARKALMLRNARRDGSDAAPGDPTVGA